MFTFDRTAITFGFVPAISDENDILTRSPNVFWSFSTTNRSVTIVQGLCPKAFKRAIGYSVRVERSVKYCGAVHSNVGAQFPAAFQVEDGKDREFRACRLVAVGLT
jgi:hypothetical protein